MRIVSFLPTATETLLALGAGGDLVGISHESRGIAAVRRLPVVSELTYDENLLRGEQIDALVTRTFAAGGSIYRVHHELLRELRPDLLIVQELCHVCALTANDLQTLLERLAPRPRVLSLRAGTLGEAFEDMQRIAWETQCTAAGRALVARLQQRVDGIHELTARQRPRRVFCLEWPRPLYNSGHWVPELVSLAGGRDDLATAGAPSRPVEWPQLRAYDPEVIVAMICGFDRGRATRELAVMRGYPGFRQLQAARQGNFWVTDGPRYFSQAGPGLVDGLAVLVKIFHPDKAGSPTADEAVPLPL